MSRKINSTRSQSQGRRKGVKVSRGPVLKRGPENLDNKEKLENTKNSFFLGPKLQAYRALKLSSPRPVYLVYVKVNLRVGRGPVHSGFTGPGWALDAPG
jgi:hypothetical protein